MSFAPVLSDPEKIVTLPCRELARALGDKGAIVFSEVEQVILRSAVSSF